jgi:hypothetical protein
MPRSTPFIVLALTLALLATPPAAVQAGDGDQLAQISGDPNQPRRHFRVRRPAKLAPEEAESIYQGLIDDLIAGYAAAEHPAARDYRNWPRYNTAPYLSVTHGNVYINNYANETAEAYGRFEESGRLPVGAVVAKDSFIAERSGEIRPGPLFLMEKMGKGFNYVSGDWRYIMIMPDGVLFGETYGEDAERVEYCIACHLAVEDQDHLFFVPSPFRTGE